MADTVLFTDNTYGTISGALTASDTSISLTTGHGARFPAVATGQVLYATLLNSSNILEQIHITAHTANSDTLTVTRGANGTTAKAWSAGDRIECRITSEHFSAFANFLSTAQSWTKAQRGTPVALGSTSSVVNTDLSLANNFTLAMTENTTLATPTNVVAGQAGCVVVTQNATAAYTMAFSSFWKFPGGSTAVLSTGTSKVDLLTYYVESTTRASVVLTNDLS